MVAIVAVIVVAIVVVASAHRPACSVRSPTREHRVRRRHRTPALLSEVRVRVRVRVRASSRVRERERARLVRWLEWA